MSIQARTTMENSAEHKETNENGNEGTPDTNCLSRFMKTVFGLEKGITIVYIHTHTHAHAHVDH